MLTTVQRISGTLTVVPLWGIIVREYHACILCILVHCIAHLNTIALNLFASKLVQGVSAASSVYITNFKMISDGIDNTQA